MSDVFGRALLDWVNGGTMAEIVEREDGFTQIGAGPEVYLAPPTGWPAAERQALRHLRGRVLDVGCGAGRVALALQQRGFEVVGLDASPLAIRAATIHGVEHVRRGSIERLTSTVGDFDSLVLFGNNFGLFATPERARELLGEWASAARPTARLFLESTSAYFGGAPGFDRSYYRRNLELGVAPGHVSLRYHYDGMTGEWFSWLFVSPPEMRKVLAGTGWHIARVLQDKLSEPYVVIVEKD